MSRSNNENKVSPSQRNFEWAGNKGVFKYYNKEDGNTEIPLPFKFIILDRLFCIRGFSDADNSGFWSNDVKDLAEPFTVRTKKGVEARGLYADIKGEIIPKGAKFATKLYIGYYDKKVLKIGTLTIFGTAQGAFIDFGKGKDIYKGAIEVKTSTEGKKGTNVFQSPDFEVIELSKASEEKAKELDVIVQAYLGKPKVSSPAEIDNAAVEEKETEGERERFEDVPASDDSLDLPF